MRYRNNPFNIRYDARNNWLGQIQAKNGFCQFSNVYFGIRAVCKILSSYRKVLQSDFTIENILMRFAPPSENDTFMYIDFVRDYAEVSKDALLDNSIVLTDVLLAMAVYESRTHLDYNMVLKLVQRYLI